MTISLKHAFSSAIADDPTAAGAGKVLPSHWNAEHTFTMATSKILGRSTASTGAVEELSLSQALDQIGSATQGDILYRGASAWARLGAGAAGDALTSGGAGANPAWGGALPVGAVLPFAGTTAPTGFLFCYGQAVSRTTYSALFTALSTTYGTGDGSTTFNLPDLRGRAPFGDDNMGGSTAGRITAASGITGTTLGASGGAETTTLTTAELPSHTHTATTDSGGSHTHTGTTDAGGIHTHPEAAASGASGSVARPVGGSSGSTAIDPFIDAAGEHTHTFTTDSGGAHTHTLTTASAGSGSAFSNMPPALILNYIIKT